MSMPGESAVESDIQTVLDTLSDPDCREILGFLGTERTAQEVTDRCDLPQTTAYRKLEALSEADLVVEGTELRTDGHHVKTYERDITGVFLFLEDDTDFELQLVDEPHDSHHRLAQMWSRVSEEL